LINQRQRSKTVELEFEYPLWIIEGRTGARSQHGPKRAKVRQTYVGFRNFVFVFFDSSTGECGAILGEDISFARPPVVRLDQ
jgi:hypothetical protein